MTDIASDILGGGMPGLSGWIFRWLCARLVCGTLSVVTPDGKRFVHSAAAASPAAALTLHRWGALRRLVFGGGVGFAEGYMQGDWSSPDLTALIELAARNLATLPKAPRGAVLAQLAHRLRHHLRANTLKGSRRNIREHYDLGNTFYERWLDRGMSYSSALYRDGGMTLEAAQTAKQDRILEMLDLKPGHEVLEIGCGWGGLAERLAAEKCRVTALTLSPAQHAYAGARLSATGLGERVDLRLQDYREVGGYFDRIVSIEMVEAVGEAYWPTYFAALRDRLKPGGCAVLQVITIADERFERYRRTVDFIQRYIFPGGMLPSPSALATEAARAGLVVQSVETFGASYARTLGEWRKRFAAAWPELAAMGFSERFRRMWEYYLCYCEAGFRAGTIDVGLWRLARF